MSQITLSQNDQIETKTDCNYSCLIGDLSCTEYKMCIARKKLQEHIHRRYLSHKDKALHKYFIDPPIERDIAEVLRDCILAGFKCKYCDTPLNMWATHAKLQDAISLDRIIPLHCSGNNKKSNLQIICHKCNIVKTRIHPDYFDTIITVLYEKYGYGGVNKYLDVLYPILFAKDVRNWNKEGE